jgi:YHS domain-containing protein
MVLAATWAHRAEEIPPTRTDRRDQRGVSGCAAAENKAIVALSLGAFESSRSAKALPKTQRLEAENPGFALRPDMFIDVEYPLSLPATLTVPTEAILETGLHKTVFVEVGEGYFEPRHITTGWRISGRAEVISGLVEGERIVASGNFLLDSESRLKRAAMGMQEDLAEDPACRMKVDKTKAGAWETNFQGKIYYFCSSGCKEKFTRNPGKYIQPQTKAAAMQMPDRSDAQPQDTSQDPVCGMEVSTAEARRAGRTSTFQGKAYCFCADSCKRSFDENPQQFAGKSKQDGLSQHE